MNPSDRARLIIWIRRGIQCFCLVLFFALLLATRDQQGAAPSGWLRLFFTIDPLILLSTWLSTHTLANLSLLALTTVGITLLLGRVFCGWICPFGTLHNMMSWLRARRRKPPHAEAFSGWQRAKYLLLFALLMMSLLGAHWVGVFDPAPMLYRSISTSFLPATQQAVEQSANAVYQEDPHIGSLHLTRITEPVYRFFRDQVFVAGRPVFVGSAFILFLFLVALGLNLYRPRFWCRYVCPLGALLGLCARRPLLRLSEAGVECTNCQLCTISCPAAAQPERPGQWLPTECFGCWNCVAACRRGGIDFHFAWPWRKTPAATVNLTRRSILTSLAGGLGAALFFRVPPQAQARSYNPSLVRPPGARAERDFLDRCIQCGLCMKICPANGLHPTLFEAGLEGMWTPMLVARLGYCDYGCNLCGQICPTDAITALPLEEKKKVKIGIATVDTTRCLPYAYDRECIVCEEHCPTPTKAIYFVEGESAGHGGTVKTLKLPRVDAELCIGCGICETKCPFEDMAAIRITSANETRHPKNQPILPDASGEDPYYSSDGSSGRRTRSSIT